MLTLLCNGRDFRVIAHTDAGAVLQLAIKGAQLDVEDFSAQRSWLLAVVERNPALVREVDKFALRAGLAQVEIAKAHMGGQALVDFAVGRAQGRFLGGALAIGVQSWA